MADALILIITYGKGEGRIDAQFGSNLADRSQSTGSIRCIDNMTPI